jgi:HD-GYP domain-containing protein (c-di-GMP phosphodiesterase class II)
VSIATSDTNDSISRALYLYLVAVILAGITAAGAVAIVNHPGSRVDLWAVALLLILAAAAERYHLHLTHKTRIHVASALYIAMVLVLPTGLPGILAIIAVGIGYGTQRRDLVESLFNVGQTAFYVTAGAVTFRFVIDRVDTAILGPILAAAIAVLTIQVVNRTLVVGASALQMQQPLIRLWKRSLRDNIPAHATMSGLGIIAAIVSIAEPLVLPVLASPLILVHYSVRQLIRLQADTRDALATLVDVVELRDPYTAGHSLRVARMARMIAIELGLTAQEADAIESAGKVHDVGKVAVDPEILTKDGKLDDNEWEQMRLHPVHGAKIVAQFNSYVDGYQLVRHHHERWDGKGYPDGIAGEEIPLGARILAVADTYDALTSNRPYRSAMSHETAIDILNSGAGTQWDPRVVDAFIACLSQDERSVRNMVEPLAPLPA